MPLRVMLGPPSMDTPSWEIEVWPNGLYKAEVIHRRSWQSLEAVELATLEWVNWFNLRRLLEPISNIPPAEAEAAYYQQTRELAMAA